MKITITPLEDSLADCPTPVELEVLPDEGTIELSMPSRMLYKRAGEDIEIIGRTLTFNLSELQHLLNYKG